jgi:hypothetical protein
MRALETTAQKTKFIEGQKKALQVKANNTLNRLNYLIELVYTSNKGCRKPYVQNKFEKQFGKALSNKNFYRYIERISFLSVENSWVHIQPSDMEKANQYVSEFLPEIFYQMHPRSAA